MLVLRRRASAEIPLAPGVDLIVRPAGQVDFDLAQVRAARNLMQGEEGEEARARYGIAGAQPVTRQEAEVSPRIATGAVAIELGIAHIVSWTGVGDELEELDEAGKPKIVAAQADAAHIAALFNMRDATGRSFGDIFLEKMQDLAILKPDAGNVSAASPAGSGAVGSTTAADAAPTATPAPPAAPA